MDVIIKPKRLSGTLEAVPSKSDLHRAIICASLAGEPSIISPVSHSDDITATIGAVRALGGSVEEFKSSLNVRHSGKNIDKCSIDCIESGSTYRFMLPVAAALGVPASFYGRGKLPQRPINDLTGALKEHGIEVFKENGEMLSIKGRLTGGIYSIRGDISSQYITGLLMALPILEDDSRIILTSQLKSKAYVDITLRCLERFGIKIEALPDGYFIKGGQKYKNQVYAVDSDYSNAAFWLSAGAVNSDITLNKLYAHSAQSDREIVSLLLKFGAGIKAYGNTVRACRNSLNGITIDAGEVPDLVPILAVVGAYASGTTVIENAGRVRIKESDRLRAMTEGLVKLGAEVTEYPDKLVIHGGKKLKGGVTVSSFNDHRIAMAMTIAALGCENEVRINGAESVNKSYPDFYSHLKMLGGECIVI